MHHPLYLYDLLQLNENIEMIFVIKKKELISRGYGYNLLKGNSLSKAELENICSQMKVLPGHKQKLLNIIMYINDVKNFK